MQRTLAYYNIPESKLSSTPTGTPLTIPTLTYGREWPLAIRFLDRIDGALVEVSRHVRSGSAKIGYIDQRPTTGGFALKITAAAQSNANTTGLLDWDVGQALFESTLNALTGKPAAIRVLQVPGGWMLWREDFGALSLSITENTMIPVAFADIDGWQDSTGRWYYEIRNKCAPLAITSTFERIDPKQPRILAVADGGATDDGTSTWNEIQKLVVPPDFRGGFIVRNSVTLSRTDRLDTAEDQDSLTEKISAMMGDAVVVSDTEVPGVMFLEFSGDSLAGIDHPLLEIEVVDTPDGDLTFTLRLDRPELGAALRQSSTLKDVPLELEFDFVDSAEDEDNEDAPGSVSISSGLKVTLATGVGWNGLGAAVGTNWLLPIKDRTLMRWSPDQVATGVQHYHGVGSGSSPTVNVAIPHNLDSTAIAELMVVNNATGEIYTRGIDYLAVITNENVVTIHWLLDPPPVPNETIFTVTAAIPVSSWAGHTHDTAQISRDGHALNEILDNIGERLVVLEGILPSTGPAAKSSQASGITIRLPQTKEVLFYTGRSSDLFDEDGVIDTALLPTGRPPYMLPACHDATVTNVVAVPAIAAGEVWKNNAAPVLTLGGGGGIRSAKVKQDEFMASDERMVFAASQSGTSSSFHPKAFERNLWEIAIHDKMLTPNRTLDVQFGLALQLLNSSCDAQWVLVIEKGAFTADTTPGTPGTNLKAVQWDATPILSQRLILTPLLQTHSFGARVKRTIVGSTDTLALDTLLYGVWAGNNAQAPALANFAVRARLINFDTENASASDARGWVSYQIISPSGFGDGSDEEAQGPIATIS